MYVHCTVVCSLLKRISQVRMDGFIYFLNERSFVDHNKQVSRTPLLNFILAKRVIHLSSIYMYLRMYMHIIYNAAPAVESSCQTANFWSAFALYEN